MRRSFVGIEYNRRHKESRMSFTIQVASIVEKWISEAAMLRGMSAETMLGLIAEAHFPVCDQCGGTGWLYGPWTNYDPDPNCPQCGGAGTYEHWYSDEASGYGMTDSHSVWKNCDCAYRQRRENCEVCAGTGKGISKMPTIDAIRRKTELPAPTNVTG